MIHLMLPVLLIQIQLSQEKLYRIHSIIWSNLLCTVERKKPCYRKGLTQTQKLEPKFSFKLIALFTKILRSKQVHTNINQRMSEPDLQSTREVLQKRPGEKLVKRRSFSILSSLKTKHPIIFAVRERVSRRKKESVSHKKELAFQLIPFSTEVQRELTLVMHTAYSRAENCTYASRSPYQHSICTCILYSSFPV